MEGNYPASEIANVVKAPAEANARSPSRLWPPLGSLCLAKTTEGQPVGPIDNIAQIVYAVIQTEKSDILRKEPTFSADPQYEDQQQYGA